MEKITVSIGEYVALNGGEQNFMTPVTFVGETLGKRVVYDEDEGRAGSQDTHRALHVAAV